jgi:hypothetical protein
MNNPKTTMHLEPTEVRGKWFEVTDLNSSAATQKYVHKN